MKRTDEEIKAEIAAAEKKLEEIRKAAATESREYSEAETRSMATLAWKIADLKKEAPRPMSLQNGPLGARDSETPAGDNTAGANRLHNLGAIAKGRDFRAMFGFKPNETLDNGGFKSSAEFMQVFNSGRFDPRLQIRASMGEGIPSSGGFSVPSQFSADWLDASLPNEIVRNLCKVYNMESESLSVPGWDGADMSAGATHGGLTMTFLDESAAATAQNPKMRQIQLVARMGAIYVDASVELVQDGKNFTVNLEDALRQSLGYGIDRYLLTGTGAGQPLGVLNSPCKIQIPKESGQRQDSIVYGNLKKLFARQLNPSRAVWLFNNSTIPELLEQSVGVGTGGSFVPLLREAEGKFQIFGRPVYFHPSLPALGDADDCAFVDFGFYALGLRQEMWVDQTDAVRWLYRERSFRILVRFDGQATLNSAVIPEHGDSMSPIVTLAERA